MQNKNFTSLNHVPGRYLVSTWFYRGLLTLTLLLTLGLGEMFGWVMWGNLYWDNTNKQWDNVTLVIGRSGCSKGYRFAKLDNTNLYYKWVDFDDWNDLYFINAAWSDDESCNGDTPWDRVKNFDDADRFQPYKGNYNDNKGSGSAIRYYFNGVHTSDVWKNLPLKTATIKVKKSTNGGAYTILESGDWPAEISTKGTTMNGNNATQQSTITTTSGDKGEYESIPITGEVTFTLGDSQDDYVFEGWGTGDSPDYTTTEKTFNVTDNTTYYAFFRSPRYKVVYHANGGTGSMDDQYIFVDATTALSSNGFSKTNYTFVGWSTTEGGVKAYDNGESVTSLGDSEGDVIDLYAVWEDQWSLKGSGSEMGSWDGNNGLTYVSGTTYQGSVSLAASTTYQFKVYNRNASGDACWYGAGDSDGAIVFTRAGTTSQSGLANYKKNLALTTDIAGTYTFTFDTEDNSITIGFPTPSYGLTLNMQGVGSNLTPTVNYYSTALTGYSTPATLRTGALLGYYTAASSGTKVLNADGSFASTDVDGYITDGKWTRTSGATLYAQWNPIVSSPITLDIDNYLHYSGGVSIVDDECFNYSGLECRTEWKANIEKCVYTVTTNGKYHYGHHWAVYLIDEAGDTISSQPFVIKYDDSGYYEYSETVTWDLSNIDAAGTYTICVRNTYGTPKLLNLAMAPITVTYDANGGSCATGYAYYAGSALTLPTPTKANYAFAGWYDEETKIGNAGASYSPTASITLTAKWVAIINLPDTLNVSNYVDYGGHLTFSGENNEYFAYGAVTPADGWVEWKVNMNPYVYTVTIGGLYNYGHRWQVSLINSSGVTDSTCTFTKIYDKGSYEETKTWSLTSISAGVYTIKVTNLVDGGDPKLLYLALDPIKVTYDANNGSAITSAMYTGEDMTLPSPSMTGYTCAGWYDEEGTKVGDAGDDYVPSASVTLTAKWTQTVSLNMQNIGSNLSPTATYKGMTLSGYTAPTNLRSSGVLLGYYTAASDGTKVLNADGTYAADNVTDYITDGKWTKAGATTLYAQWTVVEGDTLNISNYIDYGGGLTFIDDTLNYGTGSGSHLDGYAEWKVDIKQCVYNLTLDGFYPNCGQFEAYLINSSGTTTHTFTKKCDCHAFTLNEQWDLSGITEGIYTLKVKNVIGHGSPKFVYLALDPIKVTYDANGGSCATEYAYYAGSALTLPSATRDGYVFEGWYNGETKIGDASDEYTPTASITLTARWAPIISLPNVLDKSNYYARSNDMRWYGEENEYFDYAHGNDHCRAGWVDWKVNVEKCEYTVVVNGSYGNGHQWEIYLMDGSTTKSTCTIPNADGTGSYTETKTWDLSGIESAGTYTIRVMNIREWGEPKLLSLSMNLPVVTYDANGGECEKESDMPTTCGGAVTLPSSTKTLSTFIGWYNGETKVGDAGDEYTPSADITLTAHWDEDGNSLTPSVSGTSYWSEASWSEGTPTANQVVYLVEPMVVDVAKAVVGQVVIDQNTSADAKLTIQADKGLVVTEGIWVKNASGDLVAPTAADLVLQSTSDGNATLIYELSAGAVEATVQAYCAATTDGVPGSENWTWQYVGSPFSGVPANQVYRNGYMYKWNDGWEAVKPNDDLEAFAGYCLSAQQVNDENRTFEMSGTLTTQKEVEVTVPAGKSVVVGNSWTAPIQIKQLKAADFGSYVSQNIYLFNTGMDEDGTGSEADTRYASGTYVTIPINASPYTGDSLIAPLQGFFLKNNTATEGTVTFDYDKHVRPAGDNGVVAGQLHARKLYTDEKPEVVKVKVSGSRYDDQVVLLERNDFSTAYDAGWDGDKWDGNSVAPAIYALRADGTHDAVSATDDLDGAVIGFRKGEDSQYTMSFDYNGEEVWYLNDATAKQATLIQNENTYTFKAETSDAARFIISEIPIYNVPTGMENGMNEDDTRVRKYMIDGALYIVREGKIFNAQGAAVK